MDRIPNNHSSCAQIRVVGTNAKTSTAAFRGTYPRDYSIPMFTNPSYIIGAGPNGRCHLARIPPDAFTVALNGAHSDKVFSARLFYDCNCYRYDYYYSVREPLLIGVRSTVDNSCHFTLTLPTAFGCTGAGYAIRWLTHEGITNIVLCGVDMCGGHWDGTQSGQSGEWAQLLKLQALIAECPVDVYTMSDTKLELPEWNSQTPYLTCQKH